MSKTPDSKPNRPGRLGRGLSTLMGQAIPVSRSEVDHPPAKPQSTPPSHAVDPQSPATDPLATGQDTIQLIPLAAISPNPQQPRTRFSEASLQNLANSIRAQGVMQPVLVTPGEIEGSFILVAGERRWRAAALADLQAIPAIIKQLEPQQVAEWSILENLQREDLDPIERATAFRNLIERYHLTHDEVAARLSIDRSSVTNSLRLLSLHQEVQQMVQEGILTNGHARPLVAVADLDRQLQIARHAVSRALSVRGLEEYIRSLDGDGEGSGDPAGSNEDGRQGAGGPESPDGRGAEGLAGVADPSQVGPAGGSANAGLGGDGSRTSGGSGTSGGAGGEDESVEGFFGRFSKVGRAAHFRDLEQQIGDQLNTKVRIAGGKKKGSGRLTIEFYNLEQFDELMDRLSVRLNLD